MSEIFSTLEVLSRGRYLAPASTTEFHARPRRHEPKPHATADELQPPPRRSERHPTADGSREQPGPREQHASTTEPQEQPLVLTVNASDFSALEERIVRTVELVKWEQQGRMAAEERAHQAEAARNEHLQRINELEQELHAFNSKRDHVQRRVERLFTQLDSLQLFR